MFQPDIQDKFIQLVHNEIPLRLIHVPTMKLMERSQVRRHVQRRIEEQGGGASTGGVRHLLRYAILSHRWLEDPEDEVLFKDFPGETGRGHAKLQKFCEVVKLLNVDFAWVDTCCIDKSSSAELDESIRSMFRWYRNAEVCVIYLADSRTVDDLPNDEWFKRGWTLQELLAPRHKKFLGSDWTPLKVEGDKDADAETIISAIAGLTRIPGRQLKGDFIPGPIDISQRMQWAAHRKTTRVEDRAYSLMGIFDVSFSTGYGEGGDRAFFRLVETILHISKDRDILNWAGRPASIGHPTKMIPSSPECYLDTEPSKSTTLDVPMRLTNMGLKLNLLVLELDQAGHPNRFPHTETVRFTGQDDKDIVVETSMDYKIQGNEEFALGVWNVARPTKLPRVFHGCLLVKTNYGYTKWEKLPTHRTITCSHGFGTTDYSLRDDIWEKMYL